MCFQLERAPPSDVLITINDNFFNLRRTESFYRCKNFIAVEITEKRGQILIEILPSKQLRSTQLHDSKQLFLSTALNECSFTTNPVLDSLYSGRSSKSTRNTFMESPLNSEKRRRKSVNRYLSLCLKTNEFFVFL